MKTKTALGIAVLAVTLCTCLTLAARSSENPSTLSRASQASSSAADDSLSPAAPSQRTALAAAAVSRTFDDALWPGQSFISQAAPTPIPQPFPTDPPVASKILVSPPTVEGYATVTGEPGAVAPLSYVAVINLDANTLMTATADSEGGFSAYLFAPPGSSLLVKYDVDGQYVADVWRHANQLWDPAGDFSVMNPLPGAILTIGDPPPGDGRTQEFNAVGRFGYNSGWAAWWLSGVLQVPGGGAPPGLSVQQGEPFTISLRLVGTSPALDCTGVPTSTPSVHLNLQSMFDAQGRAEPWGIWFNSFLFTPTGLAIEHEAGGELYELGGASLSSLACISEHAFEGFLERVFTIPADLPDGIYLPRFYIEGNPPAAHDQPYVSVWYHEAALAELPLLRVGDVGPARIPWTLLGDYPIDGHRGVQARQDVGFFSMPTRVRYPPHQVIIPRLDERTGAPLVYRLEPGSHWLSATDRRMPCPPHIKLAFPSGMLRVEVLKPDGTVDTLGPAPIWQSSVRTPTTPGGAPLDQGTGHIGDLYHLTTLNEAFAYRFEQYGPHVIFMLGVVHDIYGNVYNLESTYDIIVARVLDLDPAQLPTTPYQQGDAFAPGLHLFPPVPAEVTVRLVQMPFSDPTQATTATITGVANRFGYFQPPPGTEIRLAAPGEFRVDITAEYLAPDGTLWAGAMTWGNVVEGPAAQIEAHGRRGMDYKEDTIDDMPAWFENANLPLNKLGIENYYPYFSGDIHWGDESADRPWKGDSIHSILTLKDLTGANETFYNLLREHFPRARNCFRWPPEGCNFEGLEKRIAIGEAPLFITTQSGIDPAVSPEDIDLWGYGYASSERPDVHVREIISEDGMGTAYWRFNDTYGYQIGEPADGDQPGDLKWEFGGVVLRAPSEGINEYAIYSSLWVLLPHGDEVGARVTPPFQDATGAGINGGPIMTLLGAEIDMLFLPKGVRPGDILELGDTISFSGHVGPPLDSRVDVTIASPTGATYSRTWHANKIGWLYDPTFDLSADEPGRWTVDVSVVHDRPYVGNGATPQSHNSGTVLGTSGQYEFYVVEPGSPSLFVASPQPGFIIWPYREVQPIQIRGIAPAGTNVVHYTIHDKGVVMGQGVVTPDASGAFTLVYDAKALHEDFSNLSLIAHEGQWEGLADEVAINLLAVGAGEVRANTVTLIGEEVFVGGGMGHRVCLPLALK